MQNAHNVGCTGVYRVSQCLRYKGCTGATVLRGYLGSRRGNSADGTLGER